MVSPMILQQQPLSIHAPLKHLVRIWVREKFVGGKFEEYTENKPKYLLGIIYWDSDELKLDRKVLLRVSNQSVLQADIKPFVIKKNDAIAVFVFDWKRTLPYLQVLKIVELINDGFFNKAIIVANTFSWVVEKRYANHPQILIIDRGSLVSELRILGVILK